MMKKPDNHYYIKLAIEKARENMQSGGGPFGAVIVRENSVIAASGNQVTLINDPTAHAEVLAIREAASKLGTWNLQGCTIYTSCEPCPMCLGAIYWAHIDKIFYASEQSDAKEAGFDDAFIYKELEKPKNMREIPMSQCERKLGRDVFQEWIEKEDKIKY